jgi:endonuclease/exonuclease/phosphatase family metal-dependent hydrolase
MRLRVLIWNLMHGRSVPGAGRGLFDEFAAALAAWEWDAALLQEVPPWWPEPLAKRLDAEYRMVLTSRNALLPVRRAIATRRPDAIKSNGGGANAILARRDRISAHRAQRLCRVPERRWAHGVRLACGIWVANLHATAHHTDGARRDGRLAAASALSWAGGEPVVLAGDFNLRDPAFAGFGSVGGRDVDHIFVAGLEPTGAATVLERGRLSDHPPLAVTVRRADSDYASRPGSPRTRAMIAGEAVAGEPLSNGGSGSYSIPS